MAGIEISVAINCREVEAGEKYPGNCTLDNLSITGLDNIQVKVRNAETKCCQCRAAKAVSGAVEDGWHKEWIGRRSFYFISEPFFEAVLMTRHTTLCSL